MKGDHTIRMKEVAYQLGVTPRRLRRMTLAGEGPPAIQLGPRLLKYRAAEVNNWIAQRTQRTQNEER